MKGGDIFRSRQRYCDISSMKKIIAKIELPSNAQEAKIELMVPPVRDRAQNTLEEKRSPRYARVVYTNRPSWCGARSIQFILSAANFTVGVPPPYGDGN